MKVKKNAENSRLRISDDVIITVARLATLEIEGVAGLAGEVNKFSKVKNNAPIKISTIGDVAGIDIKIKVKGGAKVFQVAQEVQTAVKEKVQTMTGIPVAQVNVTISGAVFE